MVNLIRANLLLIEIGIVIFLFLVYYFFESQIPRLKRIQNGLFLVLIFGIPIFFTSITRSVFEVNKLMLLRVVSLLVLGVWSTRAILINYGKATEEQYKGKEYYRFFGIRWYKTGLEIPLLIWLIINFLSAAFSKNIFVSIIGSYDRWEGILTIVNYSFLIIVFAKLVNSTKFFYWVFFSFIVSASLSAIYGIFQSNGMDFMNWSADATVRAFGSINNPVHYGPYIGMMIPLAFGYMLQINYFKDKLKKSVFYSLYVLAFALTLIIYYAMFLSWGRGTWLGFQGAMTFFLLFVTRSFDEKDKSHFFIDFVLTIFFVGMLYVNILFNVYTIGLSVILPALGYVVFYVLWALRRNSFLNLIERMLIIFLMMTTQFISIGISYFIGYLSMLVALLLLHIKIYKGNSIFIKNKLLIVVLFSFGFIVFVPVIPGLYKQYFSEVKTGKTLRVLRTAKSKLSSYKTEAIGGHSPRISMWKSGITWGIRNPLLGTGPDTIKEMYPYYRRIEYARAEGGHNLTPDRLHNEYVNTLATTGFFGLIARYGLVMGMYMFIILGYMYKNRNKPSYFLMASTLAGVMFYQGQVLFNFGVVATSSLNYQLLGLGVAIGYYNLGNLHND